MKNPPERRGWSRPSPQSILIVDDDDDLRASLRDLLEAERFAVLEAPNGKEALALLMGRQTSTPSLILLDLQMPIMSGVEFLGVIESDASLATIPVVISSGLPPDPRILGQSNVAGWARKPCDSNELIRLVRAHACDPEPARSRAEILMRRPAS